jgi:hypothetical protein
LAAADGGIGDGRVGVGVPVDGRRYIESMVGRSEAPNGVERKSVGRSVGLVNGVHRRDRKGRGLPLI